MVINKKALNEVGVIKKIALNVNELLINWIGQAGFIFKNKDNTVLCIDPYYSNSIERYEGHQSRRTWFNKFNIEKFKPDFVICTHDHLDHTDPETIPLINSYSNAIFYGPKSSCNHIKKMNVLSTRIRVIKIGEFYSFKNIKFKPVFADHTKDSCGIIFYFDNLKIYITGDTSINDELFKIVNENIDILITCINGKYGNLNIEESINLFKKIKAKIIIPMHYGLIPNNTVDILKFIEKCSNYKIDYVICKPEDNYVIRKNQNFITIKKLICSITNDIKTFPI